MHVPGPIVLLLCCVQGQRSEDFASSTSGNCQLSKVALELDIMELLLELCMHLKVIDNNNIFLIQWFCILVL